MRHSMHAGLKDHGFFKAVQALLGKFMWFPVCFNSSGTTCILGGWDWISIIERLAWLFLWKLIK